MICSSPPTNQWVASIVFVALLLILTSCETDRRRSNSDTDTAASVSTPELGTSQPLSESDITIPSAAPIITPTAVPSPTAKNLLDREEELNEVLYNPIQIPVLDNFYLENNPVNGEPLGASGPMPTRIIASTYECELISIDPLTGQSVLIWLYSGTDYWDFDCDNINGGSEATPSIEGTISYIENLEWIDSRYLLVSLCCEPATGRFEVIDTSQSNQPYFLALSGGSPSVNKSNMLLYSIPSIFRREFSAIGSVMFEVNYDASEPGNPFLSLESDTIFYTLSFAPYHTSGTNGFVSELSWVGDSKIVFEMWIDSPYSGWYPFIGIFDTVSQSAAFKSRGDGWTLPTGDANENLVVAEQSCNYIGMISNTCNTYGGKVVLLEPDTLIPIYEFTVHENIVDMDLARGLLLVTFSNGEMGIFNLSDGSFTAIADRITNAIWVE